METKKQQDKINKVKEKGSYWSNKPFAEKLAHLTNLPGSKKKKFKKKQKHK